MRMPNQAAARPRGAAARINLARGGVGPSQRSPRRPSPSGSGCGAGNAQLDLTAPGPRPEVLGFDCGCWEDPATGQCVDYSCTCDGPLSCFVLKVGCAISGGDWGGWDDDECTWSLARQGFTFRPL